MHALSSLLLMTLMVNTIHHATRFSLASLLRHDIVVCLATLPNIRGQSAIEDTLYGDDCFGLKEDSLIS